MKCPICNSVMESIDVAPCWDCGHSRRELEELHNDEHEYFIYKIFGTEIVLCDFCDADFDSYYPEYFGLPEGLPQSYPFSSQRTLLKDPKVQLDYYCSECQHRLKFLNFLKEVRIKNSPT
ncbi:hypothetical protein P5E37_29165 [Vibrio parahaemolyticus]|nr:hypothetical protein [Vibrio parahaemolyticus]